MSVILSVIIATKDSERFLPKCLASLEVALVQSRCARAVEYICVDAGSKDRTLAIVEKSGLGVKILRQQGRGLYAALNEAVAYAKGMAIMFVHSDDCLEKFSVDLRTLQKNEIVYGAVRFIGVNGEVLYTRKPPLFRKRWLRYATLIFHPNAIYPREQLLRCPFDECRYGLSADRYQLVELAKICTFRREKKLVYQFRVWGGSSSVRSKRCRGWRETLMYWSIRIYMYVLWEDNRLQRVVKALNGKRAFHAVES